jgi:hypothetical protein
MLTVERSIALCNVLSQTAEALAMMRARKRTWGVFLGIGDYSGGDASFRIAAYERSKVTALDQTTAPAATHQPALKDVVYVDKHPQVGAALFKALMCRSFIPYSLRSSFSHG